MADQYSPSVPRRARSRSRGNAVAEAREREAAAARTPTPTQPPPVPSAYLPPMVSRGRAQTPQQPPSSFPGDPSAAQLPASPAGSAVSASGADAVPGRPGRPQRERGWAAKFGSGNWKHLAMGGGGSGGGSGASGSDVGSNISAPSTPSQADRLAGGARNVADGVMRMFAGGGSSGNDPRSGGTDGGRGRGGSVGASGNAVVLEVEQARFVDDRFDPDEYILTALHNNSEDGVRSFYRKLGDAKDTAATDLKANVYKNYGEFVVISKEIAQLETDMLMLRGLLTDMRGVHSHFRAAIGMASAADEDANTETDASRGSRKRGGGGSNADPGSGVGDMAGSTVNLNGSTSSTGTTQQQQLQALQAMYDTVEHAAKVLPPLGPGLPPRTMVHQGPLLELDAAYRFKNSVHAYLVSDAVLVATKRRRGLKSRYVADRMLGVAEVSILDVRDSPDVACAFKLVRGTAAVVYRADSLAEKKAWMVAIKRQCDEWNTATANAAAGLPVAGMVGDAGPGGGGEDGASFAPEVARPRLSKEAEARLQEQLDELDVLIASRDFDKALEQIDHLKAQNATGLAPRLSVLCTVLERDLMHVAAVGARRPVVTTIARLVALGHTSRARDAFLAARAAAVRDAGRRIRFQGDLAAYVRDFGAVVTLGVRVTADWYREAIPDPDHAAFLVQWARDQTRELALACVRQVSDESLTVVVSCLQASVEHIRAMRAAGLELEYVLWETVAEHVAKAIEVFERQCAELVARGIIEDTFDPIKNDYNDGITRSTMQFCKTMLEFMNHTKFFHSLAQFQAQIAGCIAGLFEAFTNWQIQVYREKPLDLTQKAAVGTNLQFATQVFLPKVIHQLEKQCRTKLVSFVPVREKLDAIVREAGLSIGSGSAQLSRSTSRAGLASGTGTPSRRPSAATGLLHASSSISSGGGIAADPAAAASTNSPTTATGSRNRLSSMTGSLERRPSTASASGRLSPLAAASASPSVRNSSSSVAGEDGARRGSAGSHASSSSAAAAGIVAESAGRPRRPTRDGSQPELRARSRSPGGPGVGGAAAADGIRRTSAWQSTPALSSSSTTPPPPGNLSPPNASGGGSPASARRGVSPGPGSGRRSRSPAGSMPRLNTATDSTGPLLDLSARLAAGSMDLDAQWPGTLAAHMQPTVGMRRLVGAAQTDGSVADRVLVSAAASAAATSPAGRSGGSVSVVAATQVVLDIHYLLNAVNVSDAAAAAGQELCEKALRAYLVAGGDPTRLMGGDWYEQRVSDALARESSGR